jgi:hypothetical protein
VLAPAYPGFEAEVEALNADPAPVEHVTIDSIVERLVGVVAALPTPPILIGHSAGGVFTQLLMDSGYGAAGVALNSAPTEGVPVVPLSQVKSTFPVLKNPANRHKAVRYGFEQWNYAFTNTFPQERARALYERYAVPVSGHILFETALANLTPGHGGTYVDYHNDNRAAALRLRQRGQHHAAEGAVVQREALREREDTDRERRIRRQAAPAARRARVGGDRRLRPRVGVAARCRAVTTCITHIGGPTTLIEVEGWRLLTDPTFDPPGRRYAFGWGTGSRKLIGPAVAAADIGLVDAVLLTHDHHGDNLDDAGRALLPTVGRVVTTVPGARRLGALPPGTAGGPGGLQPRTRGAARLPAVARAGPSDRRGVGSACARLHLTVDDRPVSRRFAGNARATDKDHVDHTRPSPSRPSAPPRHR